MITGVQHVRHVCDYQVLTCMLIDSPDNLKYVKRVRTRSADTRPSSPSPTNKTGSTEDLLPKPTHSALSSALPRVPAINRPVLNVPRREQPVLAHSLVADSPFIVERVRSIPKQPPTSAPLQRPAPRPSKRIERPHGVSSWLHGPSTPSSPLPLSPPELIATTSQPTQPPLSSKFPKSHGLGFASSSTPLAQSSSPFCKFSQLGACQYLSVFSGERAATSSELFYEFDASEASA